MQKDPTTQALCAALDGELSKTVAGIYNILMFNALNTAGDTPFAHELVNELAWQFHCDYFDPDADIETKKAVVKESIKIHRRKGTPQAVIDLLKAAFASETYLYEWFQYGGEPYHFKIVTSSLNGVDVNSFLKALNSVKNARSYLDGIELLEGIESAIVSRSESKSTLDYSMLVGNFEAYVFGDDEVLAFGIAEREYSFINTGKETTTAEISDNVLYVSGSGSGEIIDNVLHISGSGNAEISDNIMYIS